MCPLWPTTCFGIKDSSVYLNMKMAKRDPRRALTVLKPRGNAFSAKKPIWGPSWIEKPLILAENAQKWHFWPFWTKKFQSSKLMLYHMGGPTDLADGSK